MEISRTTRRRRLGIELRRLREECEFTGEDAARHLDCSHSKISKFETGKAVLKIIEVKALLELYGVTDPGKQEPLLEMARQARQKSWWDTYDDVLPTGFDTYVGLETEAASVRAFDGQLVHGLLQTEGYAREVIRSTRPEDGTGIVERLVELRMRRQAVLDRVGEPAPFKLWSIIDEGALRRHIGDRELMAAQLAHLVEMSRRPNVTVQVLPFEAGSHPGLGGPFTLLEFPDMSDLDVVYVDTGAGNLYLEKVRDVRRHTDLFDMLRAAALPFDESVRLIEAVMRGMA